MPQEEANPQAPEKKSFFTPFTCCLGCGGLGIVVMGLLGYFIYYLYSNMLDDNPLPFNMAPAAEVQVAAMEGKVKALESGVQPSISLTVDEVNALIQEKFLPVFAAKFDAEPEQCKSVYGLTPDGKLDFKFSCPIWGRHLNVQFIGRAFFEDEKLQFSDVDKCQIGQFSDPEALRSYIATTFKEQIIQNKLNTIRIENGQMVVTAPPGKQAEGGAQPPKADDGGADQKPKE